jgi:hypothetical protein
LAQTKPRRGKGRPPVLRLRRDDERKPVSVKELALTLPEQAWQVIEWREGSNDVLNGRFARVRVHAAHRDNLRSALRPEEWLVIEWPESEKEPTKYWLSTLPPTFPSISSSTPSNCGGASNAIIKSSNKRSASAITKAADGAASTTTPRCASPLTGS